MATASIIVKQGSTQEFACQMQLSDGTPVNLSAATIAASFRDPLATVTIAGTIALAVATGAFVINLTSANTAAMPAGLMFGDVEVTLPSGVFLSDTFALSVVASVTGGS